MQVASDASPSGRCYQHLAELHTSHRPDALDVLNLDRLVQPLRPAPDSETWAARLVGFSSAQAAPARGRLTYAVTSSPPQQHGEAVTMRRAGRRREI